jgi:chromosome segregation ATPase
MSRLDEARQRFDRSLVALDAQVKAVAETRRELDSARARIAALDGERESLLARIAALEEENRAVSGLAEEVENRLDGAIEDIRSALGRS